MKKNLYKIAFERQFSRKKTVFLRLNTFFLICNAFKRIFRYLQRVLAHRSLFVMRLNALIVIYNTFKLIVLVVVPFFKLKRSLKAPFERVCSSAFKRNHSLSVKMHFLACFFFKK
jgi:hypothetical protein